MQMHCGTPAAGHANQIALNGLARAARVAVSINGGDIDRANAASATHPGNRAAHSALDACLCGLPRYLTHGPRTHVDDSLHLDAAVP